MARENSTTEPPMRQEIVKACWRAATNAKKNEKKWGNVGALNFGGAIKRLARGYSSVVELSTACLLYTSPSPRDKRQSRMPSSA